MEFLPLATHVTDKLPANFQFVGLIHAALPNARIIHIPVTQSIPACLCFPILFSGSANSTPTISVNWAVITEPTKG